MRDTYLVPLPGGERTVTVSGPFPLSYAEWSHFLTVLAAMMPGLVTPEPDITPGPPRSDLRVTEVPGNTLDELWSLSDDPEFRNLSRENGGHRRRVLLEETGDA